MNTRPGLVSGADGSSAPEQVVLVHGIGSRAGVWKPVQRLIEGSHDVLAIDLPGFNATPLGSVVPTVEGFADAIEGMLDERGITEAAIAGFSLGGAIALELGRRGRATRVVAFAPIGFWRRTGASWCRTTVTNVHRAAPLTRRILPILVRWGWSRRVSLGLFYGRPESVSPVDARRDFEAFGGADVLPETARLMSAYRQSAPVPSTVPVTIAWGTKDRLLPPLLQQRRARRLIPHARHVVLDGCGHVPFYDDPHACRLALVTS